MQLIIFLNGEITFALTMQIDCLL